MDLQDLSGGLPGEKEFATAERPAEPFWAENLMFFLYAPRADVGMWLHLGSVPNEWDMWEDRVMIALPDDEGLLSMWAYFRTRSEDKPAGANLRFRCVEPFRRWKITFDGYAQHIPYADMEAGLAPDGLRKRLRLDLDLECATPVWDAHSAEHVHGGKGTMKTQGWAKEHYEQLFRADGTMQVDAKVYPIEGSGWRDHSRGPRGGGESGGSPGWGGHTVASCLFPSGKAFIASSFWNREGLITLEGAMVVDAAGEAHYAEVIERPRLSRLQMYGEALPIHLRWPGGELKTTMQVKRTIWSSMQKRLAVGKDLSGAGLMYVLNFGPCEWDGETGYVQLERSDPLNAPPPPLHAA